MTTALLETSVPVAEAFLDDLPLDRGSSEPLSSQLVRSIRTLALSGVLQGGTKLPASRALAARLGLARNTVLDAYDVLVSEGWALSRRGAGTFLAGLGDGPKPPTAQTENAHRAAPLSRRGLALLAEPGARPGPSGLRILAPGVPALDRFPFEPWNRSLTRGARTAGQALLACEDPRGWPPLREAIAAHIGPARGVVCHPDQIVMLTSARQAVALAARLLAEPGEEAWMEEPGYPEARAALMVAGLHPVSVPVDADGLDVAAGRRIAPEARLAVVTPCHQYPLGALICASRRVALLTWAREGGAYVVENDYDGEFRHGGRPVPALASADTQGRVIYVGTFSKALFPSLRLAYLVSPPALACAFAAARASLDGHAGMAGQAGLADFIQTGRFGRHVRRMRELYAGRQAALVGAVRRRLGGALDVAPSHTGLHLVGRLDRRIDDRQVIARLDAQRYAPTALSTYYGDPAQAVPGLVLGYAGSSPAAIDAGVAAIAAAIAKVAP